MILPQDIRVGNVLYYKIFPLIPESYRIIEVVSVSKNGYISFKDVMMEEREHHLDNFEEIPITEEILLKFGFNKSSDNKHWFIGIHGFCIVFDGGDWCFKPRINDYLIVCYLKNVNELQNLCFVLTGKELTFNEFLL